MPIAAHLIDTTGSDSAALVIADSRTRGASSSRVLIFIYVACMNFPSGEITAPNIVAADKRLVNDADAGNNKIASL